MIRDKLKDMGFKITELADYLQISRPTLYKYIENYDNSEFDQIDRKVLKLFNYINDSELIGKKNVVNYILTNLNNVKDMGDSEELEVIKKVKKYIISNPESKKSQFIASCAMGDSFDEIIPYLVSIEPLLKKKKLTPEEEKLLQPYNELKAKTGGKE